MPRPYWSGQMRISLVSFGIRLFPATNHSSEITFHQIDRRTGLRVHHQNVVDHDRQVENSEIVKGYEYRKGKYIVVEPDEIAKLRIESRTTLDITQCVDVSEVPPALYEKPYFVTPQAGGADDAFSVVREVLTRTNKAGIGELAFGGREHLIAIAAPPEKNSRYLIAYTLRYEEELRKPTAYLPEIAKGAIGKKELAMATELIQRNSAPLNLSKYKDDYESALRNLIDAKRKNKPLPIEDEKPRQSNVVNLMDALRKSVGQPKSAAGRGRKHGSVSTDKQRGPRLVKSTKRARRAA
jgi:DNA end-binding protein Ku